MDLGLRCSPSRRLTFSLRVSVRSRRPTLQYCAALVALLQLVGCSSELRPVPRSELLVVPGKETVSTTPAVLPAGYTSSVSSRDAWKAYASSDGAGRAIDGDVETALSTPREHGEDLWLLVDLGNAVAIRAVKQIHGNAGHAVRYRIDVAGPKGYPWNLAWVGAGTPQESVAVFPKSIEVRFLRITVLEETAPRWGVAELEVF